MKTKHELRSEWKLKLAQIADVSLTSWSEEVSKNLLELLRVHNVIPQKLIIGAYAPYQQEPLWFLKWADEIQNQTAFPTIHDGKMIYRKARLSDLEMKKEFGPKILGPKGDAEIVEPQVILIPALAFDVTGHRLGRGKGFYDRTFEKRSDVMKIGVTFEMQMTGMIPYESHDVKMDFIVTEKRIINCKGSNT